MQRVCLFGRLDRHRIDDAKSGVIGTWTTAGRLAPLDPKSLRFVLWATTQHGADFPVQVEALTGETLVNPAFLERTVASVQAVVCGSRGEVGRWTLTISALTAGNRLTSN